MSAFPALLLTEEDGSVRASIRALTESDLPPGEVTVRVAYSTLNYKDGMILNGLGRLVKSYPHVPGVDFAGTVESSDSPAFRPGDAVICGGWRVGELHWGGYAGKARVPAAWLVPLPAGLTLRRAMAIGTAGLTAMLAVMALEESGLTPDSEGEVLVTGAAGGLGSIAVLLLSRLGYRVTASTGRASQRDYLLSLGAATIIDRAEIGANPAKPLLSERWAGAIDSVGGATLAHILSSLRSRGAVAACGNVAGVGFEGNVLPFLLRGISLLGIDAVMCPMPRRIRAWQRLTDVLPMDVLDSLTTEARLSDLPELGAAILKGDVRGRVVVDPHG
jgi:acrylyl-CoA reductase (NADPH)